MELINVTMGSHYSQTRTQVLSGNLEHCILKSEKWTWGGAVSTFCVELKPLALLLTGSNLFLN